MIDVLEEDVAPALDLEVVPRLLAPHPVDGLVGEFDDVEFVERDLGVLEVRLDPRLERRPHVDAGVGDRLALAAVRLEEIREFLHRRGVLAVGLAFAVRPERARRPHYLFSGLLTCGACGGGYTLVGARHYGCANTRNRGTCDNRLTIRRDVLEETVLHGLRENLLQPELIHEFVTTYQQEYNRLRREQASEQASAHAELAKVEPQIRNIVEAVKAGMFAPAMKDEMAALEERRAQLGELTRDQVEEPPMLHPGLAEVYRRKVEKLTQALNKEELRAEAAETLRSMIQAIRLVPEDGELAIELVGELAGILALNNEKSPRPFGSGAGQVTLVAGARCQRYLPDLKCRLWTASRPLKKPSVSL